MVRRRIILSGIVQGVGFRPFVWRTADEMKLTGFVCNTGASLLAEVQGEEKETERFLRRLLAEAPANSRVEEVTVYEAPVRAETGFRILKSRSGGQQLDLSPDLAMCDACRRELTDPSCRRFGHPFISCTACGPRFSIAAAIPYDRENTSMKAFDMCCECKREYTSPADRRYHAQPVSCLSCGPVLTLSGTDLKNLSAIEKARELILGGGIVAAKGIGGFHFICDARSEAAVKRLRKIKNREHKPLAVMARMETVPGFAAVSESERQLLSSPAAPICLLKKGPDYFLAPSVSFDTGYIGVMLPYTPLHYLLVREGDVFVATSGNFSGEPICYSDEDAETSLGPAADGLLTHGRRIMMPCDDSVAGITKAGLQVLRRSRGYVPESVTVFVKGKKPADILAAGSDLKNTICLKAGSRYILSQHIGDLMNPKNYDLFLRTIKRFGAIFGREPETFCCDLHPDYLSSGYAAGFGKVIKVQHHAAHIAAVMAEHGLEGPVIGVAFDGTGYGTDGSDWGGEFFAGMPHRFRRLYHLETVMLQGGDRASEEPERSFVSYMLHCGEDTVCDPLLKEALVKGINVCPSSSCGRLFDAAARACGIRCPQTYEARGSIIFEAMAEPCDSFWPVEIKNGEVLTAGLVPAVARALAEGAAPGECASRFHRSLAEAVLGTCIRIREETGLGAVCLSGGVFQNRLLSDTCFGLLENRGFEVYTGNRIPVNDGGLALGQAYIGQLLYEEDD